MTQFKTHTRTHIYIYTHIHDLLSKLSNISTSKSVDFFCCWATNWQKSWAALTISAFPSSGDSTFTAEWQFKTVGKKKRDLKKILLFHMYLKTSFKNISYDQNKIIILAVNKKNLNSPFSISNIFILLSKASCI